MKINLKIKISNFFLFFLPQNKLTKNILNFLAFVSTQPRDCAAVTCPINTTCKNGICFSNKLKANPCALVKCAAGFTCKGGNCVPN